MKTKSRAMVFVGFLVATYAFAAWAQQPGTGDQQDSPQEPQKVIYDTAEYNAYLSALNTLDPAARLAAFEAFIQQFPKSVLRPEAEQYAMDARVQLDNANTAEQLRQLRAEQLRQKQAEPAAASSTSMGPQQRACKIFAEGGDFSFGDMEFILQYRDSGAACNKEAAERVWGTLRSKQKSAKGDPVKMKLPVQVVSATAQSIDASLTGDNQKAGKADIHITMATPMEKPPVPGAMVDVIGFIADYKPQPFLFIMTDASLADPKTVRR